MQAEIDRLRDAVHNLRSRVVTLEVTITQTSKVLERVESKVDGLARKDEIEDAVRSTVIGRRGTFWRTWQGIVTTAGGMVVLVVALLSLYHTVFG